MIGIIDYRMGNLRSVQKAFENLGHAAEVVDAPSQLGRFDRLVLPGVGAFADGMDHLREMGWVEPLQDWVASERPMLGICLGMQLLFDRSAEGCEGDSEPVGLGLVPGQVVRFQEDQGLGQPRIKVPHMGWNVLQNLRGPVMAELKENAYVYFVHGYLCVPDDASMVAAISNHGQPFCAALQKGSLHACQFHPEKSQQNGLKILDNFTRA